MAMKGITCQHCHSQRQSSTSLSTTELCFKVQEKKKKVVVLCSLPPQNVKLGSYSQVVVVQ